MAEKFDVHAYVTDAIIAAMEAGTAPWRQPWTGERTGAGFPLRANGEAYRGINVIMLWLTAVQKGYASPYWFTFKQAKELGAHVCKGEKSTTVVYYGQAERESEDGEEVRFSFAKAYRVFNAEQIENLPTEYYTAKATEARDLGTAPDPTLEGFFVNVGARIETSDEPQAYYHPLHDHIHMPPIATFHSANGYYATLAHELTHWTGHSSRLDRLKKGRDRTAYAFEELIAEIGACMVCAHLGLVPDFEQSAAYVESWLRALKDDKRLIFTAASEAQKAYDLITQRAERSPSTLAA